MPFSGGNSTRSFNIVGNDKSHDADIRVVSPDYFQTMQIPLLKGRAFSERDSAGSPLVAILNAAAARDLFGMEDPIGKFIANLGPKSETVQIVGVVGNVRHVAPEVAPRTELYQPLAQEHWPSMFVVVRSATSDPRTLISAAQHAVWDVDNNVPLANVRTMQDMIGASIGRRKFAMLLLAIFAGLAMLLAAVGLYGVISYSVAQRTREIGIRVALGAQRRDVLRLVLNQGMLFVTFGLAAGVIGSLCVTRLIASLLFDVSPVDVCTFAIVSLLLGCVALVACWFPAQRASRVDPMIALRYE